MKILFTGSSGPKVGATVAAVLSKQNEVYGIDLMAGPTTSSMADITQIKNWEPYLLGIDVVVHFAALHAPHRATHSRADFYRTNVDCTAALIDAAKHSGVKRFLMASSTSVYGRAMRSHERAVWVTESLTPVAEDIYDETKLAGEALCREAFADDFATIALRFSRSFPEPLPDMAVYRLYRGVDARDVANAFSLALKVSLNHFEVFNISGKTPFLQSDCDQLMRDAPTVLRQRSPDLAQAYERLGWLLPCSIDRVYVTEKAQLKLGYQPEFGWHHVLSSAAFLSNH